MVRFDVANEANRLSGRKFSYDGSIYRAPMGTLGRKMSLDGGQVYRARFKKRKPTMFDRLLRWRQENPELVGDHSGDVVAFGPEGPLFFAENMEEAMKGLRERGLQEGRWLRLYFVGGPLRDGR